MFIKIYKVRLGGESKLYRRYCNAMHEFTEQADKLNKKIGLKDKVQFVKPDGCYTTHLVFLNGTELEFSNSDYAVVDDRGVQLHVSGKITKLPNKSTLYNYLNG